MADGIRVTQTSVHNIRSWPHPAVRVTDTYVEVIRALPRPANRITETYVELIRSQEIATQSGYGMTFSTLNNTDLLDWGAEVYDSYLLVTYFIPEDPVTKFGVPYLYTFLKNETTNVTDSTGAVVVDADAETVYSLPSLLMTPFWNWRDEAHELVYDQAGERVLDQNGDTIYVGVVPDSIQVYRHRDDYLNSVAKNRIRGRGRALQLRYQGEGSAGFELQGWGIYFTKNTKV